MKPKFDATRMRAILSDNPEAAEALRGYDAREIAAHGAPPKHATETPEIAPGTAPASPSPAPAAEESPVPAPAVRADLPLNAAPSTSATTAAPPVAPQPTPPPARAQLPPPEQAPLPSPAIPAEEHVAYRSLGITIYPSDERLVAEMAYYLSVSGTRMGAKLGLSLFSRAGMRLLDDLRRNDPPAFIAALERTMRERA